MVLWLAAALSVIALSVSLRVRGEIERAGVDLDGDRTYYLARGAADRALNYLLYQGNYWRPEVRLLRLPFPSGDTAVEVIPESSKLDVNLAAADELFRLLLALGQAPEAARLTASAIADWRGGGGGSAFDSMYLTRVPSFRAPHASFEQIEELMSVAGVTPELYHGGFVRLPDGRFLPRPGLADCLSVHQTGDTLDLNSAPAPVMAALGADPAAAEQLVAMRRLGPLMGDRLGAAMALLGPAAGRFQVSSTVPIYTLRATARLWTQRGRLSDVRRTVELTVRIGPNVSPEGYRVLSWRDQVLAAPLFTVWPQ
jgi:hypothetical protein